MALLKKYENQFNGLSIDNAYYNISRIELLKRESEYISRIIVSVFVSKESRDSGKNQIDELGYLQDSFRFSYDVNSQENILVQAYNYLKTLPEYQDSTDI